MTDTTFTGRSGRGRMKVCGSGWWWLARILIVLLTATLCGPALVTGASNTAGCDWTGSGLSTVRANREVISIYLRCTAGRIVWNYPRGAIRVLLRRPAHLQDNFRACLKIYPISAQLSTSSGEDPPGRARIYLEAPRRLIGLFGGGGGVNEAKARLSEGRPYDGEVLVKCFRSINGQVALYVEAEETPFANVQTVFKYNLEFINNKHYSLRTTNIAMAKRLLSERIYNGVSGDDDDDVDSDDDDDDDSDKKLQQEPQHKQITVTATPTPIDRNVLDVGRQPTDSGELHIDTSSWWMSNVRSLWRHRSSKTTTESSVVSPQPPPQPPRMAIDEQIAGRLGETYEICRPCTDVETAHAFCSSELVTRGTMFGVQQRPRLSTNEIYVNRTHLLRNNLFDILSDQDLTNGPQPQLREFGMSTKVTRTPATDIGALLSFHTPLHCATAHEPGEFVFMGRRRFEEMMVICAPRLNEWAATVERLQRSGDVPCVLSS